MGLVGWDSLYCRYASFDIGLTVPAKQEIRVADEVWIATASLHRSRPDAPDFAIAEIMAQAEAARLAGLPLRPGVKIHVYLHCVANRPPNPGRYRMLFETASGRRRLYRPSDPCHPLRSAGKTVPKRSDIPAADGHLLDWYENVYAVGASGTAADPILALRGRGRELWADEDADDYVRRQRKSWQ